MSSRTLADVEREIEVSLEEGKRNLIASAEKARHIGRCLIEAKKLLPHGEYLPWAERRFGFGRDHVAKLARIAENWTEIQRQMSEGSDIWTAVLRTSDGGGYARGGTTLLLRVSDQEAEFIRAAAVRAGAKNLNAFLKNSVLAAAAQEQLPTAPTVAALS